MKINIRILIKRVSIFIIIFMTFKPSFAQRYEIVNGDTINVIDSIGIKQGYWIEHPQNSEKKIQEGNYIDGKKEGLWKAYYSSGAIKSEITYKQGDKYGKAKILFENGNTAEEGVWIKDRWVNKYKAYYQNGKLSYVWNYNKSGNRSGYQKYYYQNGNIKIEGEWIDGKENGVIREYYPDGSLRAEKIFKDGKTGKDSVTIYEIKEKKPDGPEKKDSLINKTETHYIEPDSIGIFEGDGEHIFYNKLKQKEKEGVFENGYLINGKQYFYDSEGNLEKTAVYENGKIIKIINE